MSLNVYLNEEGCSVVYITLERGLLALHWNLRLHSNHPRRYLKVKLLRAPRGGREGGRVGGREGREGEREERREGREGEREGGRERGWEGGWEGGREEPLVLHQ